MDREMRQQLSCSVCLDLYTDPILLPCLHSLCQQCVNNLLQAVITECPECKTPIRPGGKFVPLKKNFPLDGLVQIYKRAETKRSFTFPSRNIYPNAPSVAEEIRSQANTGTNTVKYNTNQDTSLRFISDQTNQRTTSETAHPDNTSSNKENVSQKACSTCETGSASPAAVYCSTCTMSFCTACLHSIHPQGSEHEFLSVADLDKISLCVICESAATDRCLQCKMAFCTPCLASYHPTTTSGQGHILMKVKAKVTSYRLTPKDNPPPLPPRRYSKPLPKRSTHPTKSSQELSRSASTGDNPSRTSASKRFASLEIARDVREATRDRHCGLCADREKLEAVFRCLDCSVSICRGCVFTHRQDAPSHTLINIAIPGGRGESQRSRDSQEQVLEEREPRTPSSVVSVEPTDQTPNNVQKGLVDLMGARSEVMGELLQTLNNRDMSEGKLPEVTDFDVIEQRLYQH